MHVGVNGFCFTFPFFVLEICLNLLKFSLFLSTLLLNLFRLFNRANHFPNLLSVFIHGDGSTPILLFLIFKFIMLRKFLLLRVFWLFCPLVGGTLWRSCLRHCTTSRKVAGSIPDGVTGIFHWHNPSGRTMALGLTQSLTEMSTRNIFWGIKAAGTFMCRLSWNLGVSTSWNPQDLSRLVMVLLYLYLLPLF
jgi:hypothetical protein